MGTSADALGQRLAQNLMGTGGGGLTRNIEAMKSTLTSELKFLGVEGADAYVSSWASALGSMAFMEPSGRPRRISPKPLATQGTPAGQAFLQNFGNEVKQGLDQLGGQATLENLTRVLEQQGVKDAEGYAKSLTDALQGKLAQGVSAEKVTAAFHNIGYSYIGNADGQEYVSGFTKDLNAGLEKLGGQVTLENLTRVLSDMGYEDGGRFAAKLLDGMRARIGSGGGLGAEISALRDKIMGELSSKLAEVGGGSALMGGGIIAAIAASLEIGLKDVKNVFDLINKEFEAFGKVAKDSVETTMKSFVDVVHGKAPDVQGVFKVLGEGMSAAMEAPLNVLQTEVDNTVGRIPIVGEMFKGVVSEMQGAAKAAVETFNVAGSAAGEFMSTMVEVGNTYVEAARKIAATTIDPANLEKFTGDVRDIMASGAIVHFDDVASAIGRVDSNLKNMDTTQLKDFTTQLATAEEVVGHIDPTKMVGVLNAWGVGADGAAEMMNKLVNIAIKTGEPIDQLTNEMQQVGPAMRTFGYSVDQTAQFFAAMVQAGEPAQKAVFMWTSAVKEAVKSGESPGQWLHNQFTAVQQLLQEDSQGVKGAAEKAEQIIEKAFGQRAGPLILEDIRNKILDLPKAMKAMDGLDSPVDKLVEDTKGLGDTFEQVGHQIQSALEPLGMALAKGLLGAGTSVSDWLRDNQAKILHWATEVAEVILGVAADMAKMVGGMFVAVANFINPIKEMVLNTIGLITSNLQELTGALSHLPSWLGGDVFKGMNEALGHAQYTIQQLDNIDMGHNVYEFGKTLENVGDNVLPGLQNKLAGVSGQMEQNLEIAKAFNEEVNGKMVDGIGQLKDKSGALVMGTPEDPKLQLLGTGAQWEEIKAHLHALNIDIQYNTAGVITAVTTTTEKAKEAWEKWWKDFVKKPDPVNQTVQGVDANGKPITGPADLVPKDGNARSVSSWRRRQGSVGRVAWWGRGFPIRRTSPAGLGPRVASRVRRAPGWRPGGWRWWCAADTESGRVVDVAECGVGGADPPGVGRQRDDHPADPRCELRRQRGRGSVPDHAEDVGGVWGDGVRAEPAAGGPARSGCYRGPHPARQSEWVGLGRWVARSGERGRTHGGAYRSWYAHCDHTRGSGRPGSDGTCPGPSTPRPCSPRRPGSRLHPACCPGPCLHAARPACRPRCPTGADCPASRAGLPGRPPAPATPPATHRRVNGGRPASRRGGDSHPQLVVPLRPRRSRCASRAGPAAVRPSPASRHHTRRGAGPIPTAPQPPAPATPPGPGAPVAAPTPTWRDASGGWGYYRDPTNGMAYWVPSGVTRPNIGTGVPSAPGGGYEWQTTTDANGMSVYVLTRQGLFATAPPADIPHGPATSTTTTPPAPGQPAAPDGAPPNSHTIPGDQFNPDAPPPLPAGAPEGSYLEAQRGRLPHRRRQERQPATRQRPGGAHRRADSGLEVADQTSR